MKILAAAKAVLERKRRESMLSPETLEVRRLRDEMRRREDSPTRADLEEMAREAREREQYLVDNPHLFPPGK